MNIVWIVFLGRSNILILTEIWSGRLLIWEECYYAPLPCNGLPGISRIENPKIGYKDYNDSWVSTEDHVLQPRVQAWNKVHVLVNQMMSDKHVNIVGEGYYYAYLHSLLFLRFWGSCMELNLVTLWFCFPD